MLCKNQCIYNFRKKIIHEVFYGEGDYEEKNKEFESVSYDEMFYKFWKPLGSFYKNLGKK